MTRWLAFLSWIILIGLVVFKLSCGIKEKSISKVEILFNQLGYKSGLPVKVLLKNYSGKYKVTKLGDKAFLENGTVQRLEKWSFSGEEYSKITIEESVDPCTYVINLTDIDTSFKVVVSDSVYAEVLQSSIKSYYFNRCSYEISEEFGGKWKRLAGHPDTNVFVHKSVIGNSDKKSISSPGGWYDAGDYNKYIVNSSITVYTLLLAYDQYKSTLDLLDLNIPESENNIPDLIDEVVYNIRWMLTMQDNDGGVYHKLTTKKFDDFIMPSEATANRYVVMKTTPATLDFAASMAMAARVLEDVTELKSLADSCKKASTLAWEWANNYPEVYYKQPKDIFTGEYKDTCLLDEWIWAAAELSLLYKDKTYLTGHHPIEYPYSFTTPSWDCVQTLALMSLATDSTLLNVTEQKKLDSTLLGLVDELHTIYLSSPCLISLNYFKWGSNSDALNQAMLGFFTFKKTGNQKYFEMASSNLNYILGRNPTTYCYVTGFGSKSPMNIHHRPSGADGIDNPIPGFVVGGPNTIMLNDCNGVVKRSNYPALSYTDSECSYSTNETAINWNAPLVFSLSAMLD